MNRVPVLVIQQTAHSDGDATAAEPQPAVIWRDTKETARWAVFHLPQRAWKCVRADRQRSKTPTHTISVSSPCPQVTGAGMYCLNGCTVNDPVHRKINYSHSYKHVTVEVINQEKNVKMITLFIWSLFNSVVPLLGKQQSYLKMLDFKTFGMLWKNSFLGGNEVISSPIIPIMKTPTSKCTSSQVFMPSQSGKDSQNHHEDTLFLRDTILVDIKNWFWRESSGKYLS